MNPMSQDEFAALFDERLPVLFAPFVAIRERFPEMDDATFKAEVCEPIVGVLSDEFTWLVAKRLGVSVPPRHSWR